MEFDNAFEVAAAPEQAWAILTDIQRIAPCVPGAELTEVVDDDTYKGKISVRLGPVALTFQGQATFVARDDAAHSARVKAQGSDARGRGGATSEVSFALAPAEGGATTVNIHTDLQLSGSVAQYGRGVGMIADLASQIIDQFAKNLHEQIVGQDAAPAAEPAPDQAPGTEAPTPAAPAPVGGMMLRVLWNAITRAVKRLFGG